jgi:serine/threonine protein kinase
MTLFAKNSTTAPWPVQDITMTRLVQKKNIQSVYSLKQEVGRGSWGVVRKCQHRQSREWFACKTLHKARVPPELLEQEVLNLARAKGHEHLVELVEVFEDKRNIHIVTELLTGGELYEQVIQLAKTPRKRFSPRDAAWIVRDILDAIRYLHEDCNIVHRDLKASNFLFARKGVVRSIKIIDFGLTRHAVPKSEDEPAVFKEAVGTVYYVAPEVLTHDEIGYSNKCDIWSVGVIAYLLLAASLPFQGKNEKDTVKLLMSETVQAEFPESRWKDVDPLAVDFCKTLLQKDPTQRPSARDALSLPWIVKHCDEPTFMFSKVEQPIRTEKTLEMDSDLESACSGGLFTTLSTEESWSTRSKNSRSSASPVAEIGPRQYDQEALSVVLEDSSHGKKSILRRMFSRKLSSNG